MRALIAIGCNHYDHEQSLVGAEADAKRIFDALLRPELGDYDLDCSRILISPTIDDVRAAIQEVLFENGQIDTFTFFFAGHGGVKAGSFYMLMRNSIPNALSASAFSLSDLFRSINELAPMQSNIILDACESGGLIADLATLLKSNLIGDAGTPGITLIATSAQDRNADEDEFGGFGTNAILDCIEGREFIQDTDSALDLVEVGRHMSRLLQNSTSQNPFIWGLNLSGPPRFCRNLHYGHDPTKPLRTVLQAWPQSSDTQIRNSYNHIWRIYASAAEHWDSRASAQMLEFIFSELAAEPLAISRLADHLGTAIMDRAKSSHDLFQPILAGATIASSLLPFLNDDRVARHARFLQSSIGDLLLSSVSQLLADLAADPFALLSSRGGLSDLFYLPLRIAQVLAWSAATPMLFDITDPRHDLAISGFVRLTHLVLENYSESLVCLSDAMAPCWTIVLCRALSLSLNDELERFLGLLYHSLIECKARVARSDISGDDVLAYLLARNLGNFDSVADLIERPTELATVLFKAGYAAKLDELFDQDLWRVDGLTLIAYINMDLGEFAREQMSKGKNILWTIGHDLFRVRELISSWPKSETIIRSSTAEAGAVMASLLYPDRVPWFLFDNLRKDDQGPP